MATDTQVPAQMQSASAHNRLLLSRSLWWLMLVLAIAVVVLAARYFLVGTKNPHFVPYLTLLRLHIAGGMGALLAGPWQFSKRLRARALGFHRWLGRFYLLAVGLGAIAGFGMALVSEEGLPTHFGFGILAVLWLATSLEAYRQIRGAKIEVHRRWMIRNFALTLAAVTLRIELPFMLAILHWPFAGAYITVSWLCWIPNLLVAEWLVRGKF